MRHAAFFLSLLLSTPPAYATAQESLPVRPGDRVRVTAFGLVGGRSVATFLSLQSDTFLLQRGQQEAPLVVPLSSVTRFEVSRGQRSKWAEGLGIGFFVGAIVGAVVGYASGLPASRDLPSGQAAAVGAGLLSVPGALVGLAIGANTKGDRWEEVPARRH